MIKANYMELILTIIGYLLGVMGSYLLINDSGFKLNQYDKMFRLSLSIASWFSFVGIWVVNFVILVKSRKF